jgi:hypothetical protein
MQQTLYACRYCFRATSRMKHTLLAESQPPPRFFSSTGPTPQPPRCARCRPDYKGTLTVLRSDYFLGLLEGGLTALALAACQTQGSSAPQKPSIQATVTRKGRPRLPAIKARPCPPSSSPSLPPSVARASSLQALVVLQWVVPKCHMKLREQATHITNVSK